MTAGPAALPRQGSELNTQTCQGAEDSAAELVTRSSRVCSCTRTLWTHPILETRDPVPWLDSAWCFPLSSSCLFSGFAFACCPEQRPTIQS